MGNPVVHFEIVSKDADALRKFYRDAFDWQIAAPMKGAGIEDYTMVDPNEGSGIPGGIGTAPEGYDGPRHVLCRRSRSSRGTAQSRVARRQDHAGSRRGSRRSHHRTL